MSSKFTRWLLVWLLCGAAVVQVGGCVGAAADMGLKIAVMLVLDQTLGPLLGDPAGDLNPNLGNLWEFFTGPQSDGS